MTKILFKRHLSFNHYVCRRIYKVKDLVTFRCIPILGLTFIVVQLILLTFYGYVGCNSEICASDYRNASSFFRIFLWSRFYKKIVPTLPLCPPVPPDLRKYSISHKERTHKYIIMLPLYWKHIIYNAVALSNIKLLTEMAHIPGCAMMLVLIPFNCYKDHINIQWCWL